MCACQQSVVRRQWNIESTKFLSKIDFAAVKANSFVAFFFEVANTVALKLSTCLPLPPSLASGSWITNWTVDNQHLKRCQIRNYCMYIDYTLFKILVWLDHLNQLTCGWGWGCLSLLNMTHNFGEVVSGWCNVYSSTGLIYVDSYASSLSPVLNSKVFLKSNKWSNLLFYWFMIQSVWSIQLINSILDSNMTEERIIEYFGWKMPQNQMLRTKLNFWL